MATYKFCNGAGFLGERPVIAPHMQRRYSSARTRSWDAGTRVPSRWQRVRNGCEGGGLVGADQFGADDPETAEPIIGHDV